MLKLVITIFINYIRKYKYTMSIQTEQCFDTDSTQMPHLELNCADVCI